MSYYGSIWGPTRQKKAEAMPKSAREDDGVGGDEHYFKKYRNQKNCPTLPRGGGDTRVKAGEQVARAVQGVRTRGRQCIGIIEDFVHDWGGTDWVRGRVEKKNKDEKKDRTPQRGGNRLVKHAAGSMKHWSATMKLNKGKLKNSNSIPEVNYSKKKGLGGGTRCEGGTSQGVSRPKHVRGRKVRGFIEDGGSRGLPNRRITERRANRNLGSKKTNPL